MTNQTTEQAFERHFRQFDLPEPEQKKQSRPEQQRTQATRKIFNLWLLGLILLLGCAVFLFSETVDGQKVDLAQRHSFFPLFQASWARFVLEEAAYAYLAMLMAFFCFIDWFLAVLYRLRNLSINDNALGVPLAFVVIFCFVSALFFSLHDRPMTSERNIGKNEVFWRFKHDKKMSSIFELPL